MKIEQTVWTPKTGWQSALPGQLAEAAQLVLVFGGTRIFKVSEHLNEVRRAYPRAHFFGCSTAGEIAGTQVSDDSLVVTAIHFEHTQIKGAQNSIGVLGFYGDRLKVGYGSLGGWDTFGPTRLITRSQGNVLIDGASGAARTSYEAIGSTSPDLAILISCVGRKMVLKQRIEEEVESVRDVLGAKTALTGFYSYGEISPFTPGAACELHNQTMTITTLSEN